MAKTKTQTDASAPKRRRADAERSIAAITNAALEALASDPDASMAEIARRAGVVRATIYMHFPTREALLDAVMEHATGQVAEAIRNAEPDRGEPKEALERVILATWRQLSQFHNILQININRLSAQGTAPPTPPDDHAVHPSPRTRPSGRRLPRRRLRDVADRRRSRDRSRSEHRTPSRTPLRSRGRADDAHTALAAVSPRRQ